MYMFPTQEKDGNPYHVRNGFTCKAQVEGFRELLCGMAEKPQDYVSPGGCMTTNRRWSLADV